MLYKSAVSESTFKLLEDLQSVEEFLKLRLVGGTSLALQIGHRISVDLDLFGEVDFDSQLFNDFDKVQVIKKSKNINIFEINDVKVDIVNYSYPWLDNELHIENTRLASLKDIAAMKIAAVTGRGSKKDFVDLFFLLKEFSFNEIMSFYEQKYSDASIYLALKSLLYFDDADNEPPLNMLIDTHWQGVKDRIIEEVTKYSGV
jgi:predicted nucleotidyltransferase component of viral defense system